MLEFNGKRPIRKNLPIEPIILSDKQNQQLDKIMKSEKSNVYKRYMVRKTVFNSTGSGSAGGSCCVCENLPTHILKYHSC